MKKELLMERSAALILALCLAMLVPSFAISGTAAPADRSEITIVYGGGDINSYATGNKILAPNTIDWSSGMPTQIIRENVTSWYNVGDTGLWSVAVGDVDNDGQTEIVTGGSYFDGTRSCAQLTV